MPTGAYDIRVISHGARPEMSTPATSAIAARDLIRDLDAEQRRAVTSSAPLIAVIAGAGSGKTSVLTRRVAWRCVEGSAEPMHTAVITFTRQAAAELRRRLRTLGIQDSITAGTFHAISLSLLQQHWDRVGRRPPTVIQDRRRLIGEVIGPRRTTSIDELAREIDWARARNISVRSYARAALEAGRQADAATVEKVMVDVQELKAKRGVIDLDDLLSLVIDTADRDQEFADIVTWRLRHLYVDEAQDMNPLQRAVLEVWRAGRDDLTLVGDPSQSIYGFNGSDPSILLELETHFPGIEVVRLDTNYRCSPQIVRAGLVALGQLDSPTPELRSARPDGPSVKIYGFDSEEAEATGVARLVDRFRGPNDTWRQFAVLARTNAQLPPIRAALEAAGIPVRTDGIQSNDPLQSCIREVGELPSRSRLAAWARDARLVDFDHPEPMSSDPTSQDNEASKVRLATLRVAAAVDEFLSDGGSDGRSFLAWVRAQRPFDDMSTRMGVDLLTFHAAKGREWDTVLLVGCEDGLMPHSSAKSSFARDEETRLAYVAMTRAADRLLVTHARSRKGRRRQKSPLIAGIETSESTSAPTTEFLHDLRIRQSDRTPVDPVFEELTSWRSHAARVSGVDPRLICPDEVLHRLARRQPTTVEEMEDIEGLGSPLISRTGPAILTAIERGLNRRRDAD
jgi:DNA helicase-2/ATP-dependent DNA helicase PcrA